MKFFLFIGEQWLLVSILLVLVYVYILYERDRGGKSIGQNELVALLNSEHAALVDVRPSGDFTDGHIHGAISIPHTKLSSRHVELVREKDKVLVVVDQYGQHAGSAGKLLSSEGYNVRRLSGGMVEWRGQNLPVVKGS